MVDMDEIERRIRERAHQLWEREGRPEGRDAAHWEMAKELVAIEDNQRNITKPNPVAEGHVYADRVGTVEPLEAVENAGEFPTLTDQGEGRAAPVRRGKEEKQAMEEETTV
ncbi:MAG: hypothetical protein JWM77_3517 [Rhodospirillales bacterium]|nr:hypothetical protein [Rhodospirillales bacterium]